MNIILDTNLLLLLLVGYASPSYISIHKRLNAYTEDDFTLLKLLLQNAQIVVTPNTLTETSNLAGYVGEPARTSIYQTFCAMLQATETRECFIESKTAASRTEFVRLGLTESAILEMADKSHTLLTADFDLFAAACKHGL